MPSRIDPIAFEIEGDAAAECYSAFRDLGKTIPTATLIGAPNQHKDGKWRVTVAADERLLMLCMPRLVL